MSTYYDWRPEWTKMIGMDQTKNLNRMYTESRGFPQKFRELVVEWLDDVMQSLGYNRFVYDYSTYLFDSFLLKSQFYIDKQDLQAVASASAIISIQYCAGIDHQISDFVAMTANSQPSTKIIDCKFQLIALLGAEMVHVTVSEWYCFVTKVVEMSMQSILELHPEIMILFCLLCNASLYNEEFLRHENSSRVISCLIVAINHYAPHHALEANTIFGEVIAIDQWIVISSLREPLLAHFVDVKSKIGHDWKKGSKLIIDSFQPQSPQKII